MSQDYSTAKNSFNKSKASYRYPVQIEEHFKLVKTKVLNLANWSRKHNLGAITKIVDAAEQKPLKDLQY